MASDGDLYFKRVYWGFGRAYRVACAGGAPGDEATVALRGLKNAWRQLPMPALRSLLAAGVKALADHAAGLYANDVAVGMEAVRCALAAAAGPHAGSQTTAGLVQEIRAVASEALEDGAGFSRAAFREACYGRIVQRCLNRYHNGPSELNVMKARKIDRATRQAEVREVTAKLQPGAFELLRAVEASPTGSLRIRRKGNEKDVNTRESLEETSLI